MEGGGLHQPSLFLASSFSGSKVKKLALAWKVNTINIGSKEGRSLSPAPTWMKLPGLVNFVIAVAYHFCLSLPAVFTQPGQSILANPCNIGVLSMFAAYRSLTNISSIPIQRLTDCEVHQCSLNVWPTSMLHQWLSVTLPTKIGKVSYINILSIEILKRKNRALDR